MFFLKTFSYEFIDRMRLKSFNEVLLLHSRHCANHSLKKIYFNEVNVILWVKSSTCQPSTHWTPSSTQQLLLLLSQLYFLRKDGPCV